jgi:hypothetical protein
MKKVTLELRVHRPTAQRVLVPCSTPSGSPAYSVELKSAYGLAANLLSLPIGRTVRLANVPPGDLAQEGL